MFVVLLYECFEVKNHPFNDDQYQGPMKLWTRWPLTSAWPHSSICRIICRSPSTGPMKRLTEAVQTALDKRCWKNLFMIFRLVRNALSDAFEAWLSVAVGLFVFVWERMNLSYFCVSFSWLHNLLAHMPLYWGVKAWNLWLNVSNKTQLDNEKPHHCTAFIQRANYDNLPQEIMQNAACIAFGYVQNSTLCLQ